LYNEVIEKFLVELNERLSSTAESIMLAIGSCDPTCEDFTNISLLTSLAEHYNIDIVVDVERIYKCRLRTLMSASSSHFAILFLAKIVHTKTCCDFLFLAAVP